MEDEQLDLKWRYIHWSDIMDFNSCKEFKNIQRAISAQFICNTKDIYGGTHENINSDTDNCATSRCIINTGCRCQHIWYIYGKIIDRHK